jgi:predicted phosphodiesterase
MKDIGIKNNKLLLFGGVYSNLQALEAIQNKAGEFNIQAEDIICTGDIVAYCAQPIECLDLIAEWGIHTINGNVELNLLDQSDDCGCNFNQGSRCDIFSKQWYPFAKSKLEEFHYNFLRTIPDHLTFLYNDKRVVVLHGAYDNVSEYIFKSTPWATKLAIMEQLNADVIIAGHCGLPFVDIKKDKYWINPGVIGMPANDANVNTWFATLEIIDGVIKVTHLPLHYNHLQAKEEMDQQGLVPAYAKTLETGLWDNCEILPEWEEGKQGLPILLQRDIVS